MFAPFFCVLKVKILIFFPVLLNAPLTLPYKDAGRSSSIEHTLDTLKHEGEASEIEENIPPSESQNLVVDRLRCIEKTIPLVYNKRVHSFIDYFTIKDREYTRLMMSRLNLYFPLFETYLKRHNLPEELKYLAIIESGLSPSAKSKSGATGLWQFMSFTGQQFGLLNNWYVDERRDPDKATQAACMYLMDLYNRFNNWELVLLAYNSGPGKIRSAIKKAGYRKRATDIHRYLPAETQSYLSQFVAMNYSVNYHEEHELCIPIEEKTIPSDTLAVTGFLNFETFAHLTGTSLDTLCKLNPTLIRKVVPDDGKTYTLKIPITTKEFLATNRVFILDSASKIVPDAVIAHEKKIREKPKGKKQIFYTVRSGDVLLSIARRFHVDINDIQTWNHLQNSAIQVRQRLILWVPFNPKPTHTVNRKYLSSKNASSLGHNTVYTVEPGDTLWDISRKFKGLSIEKIKTLNNLQSAQLQPGQKLILQ